MSSQLLKRAVLVRMTLEDGKTFIRLDDAEGNGMDASLWKRVEFVTRKELDPGQLEEMEFDDKELAAFGYYILARLGAFRAMGEAP